MNAHLTLPVVIVKQHVLTTTDHLLVLVRLGIQEMASNVLVSILEICICFCGTFILYQEINVHDISFHIVLN